MNIVLESILKRFKVNPIKYDTNTLDVDINGYKYHFVQEGETIIVKREIDGKQTDFLVSETPRINHIFMPFMRTIDVSPSIQNFNAFDYRDIALRLHLVMKGDLYEQVELIPFVGAGAHTCKNYFYAI